MLLLLLLLLLIYYYYRALARHAMHIERDSVLANLSDYLFV